MKVIIDTEKKTIEVPQNIREQLIQRNKLNETMGLPQDTILSILDVREYKYVSKQTKTIKDGLTSKDVNDFMESIKDEQPDLYQEYIELKEKVVGKTKNDKPIKTSFLKIKAWYYEKFPEKSPFKKTK